MDRWVWRTYIFAAGKCAVVVGVIFYITAYGAAHPHNPAAF